MLDYYWFRPDDSKFSLRLLRVCSRSNTMYEVREAHEEHSALVTIESNVAEPRALTRVQYQRETTPP